MRLTRLPLLFFACLVTGIGSVSHAASISFDSSVYDPNPGNSLTVNVVYDFTDISIFGLGFALAYDPAALEFVSFTQAQWDGAGEPQHTNASPLGMLEAPGSYVGAGIGTFDFNGIYTAGLIGSFQFNILAGGTNTICGGVLCLLPDPSNPASDLIGNDITDEVFANGITVINTILPFPIPAAIWFMLSGLVTLVAAGRKRGYNP